MRLRWEHAYPVSPLEVPDQRTRPAASSLAALPAVELFVERARAADPAFRLSESNVATVAELCVGLDGLPLALEVAAAHVRALPVKAILRRLGGGVALQAPRDAPDRHRSLHAVVAWSYDLLGEQERALFARMAVFAGGCTLEAAEAICHEGIGPVGVLDLLGRLVDKSLLVVEAQPSIRYRMLEPLRLFAAERLIERDEAEQVRARHATFFLALAEEADLEVRPAHVEAEIEPEEIDWPHAPQKLAPSEQARSESARPEEPASLERVECELDNVRAALWWAVEGGQRDVGLRLAAALGEFWLMRGYLSEGRMWLQRVLDEMATDGPPAATPARTWALHAAGLLARSQGDNEAATRFHHESLTLARRQHDTRATARSLQSLGVLAFRRGEHERSEALYGKSLNLFRQLGDTRSVAYVLGIWGKLALEQGDLARAAQVQEESHALMKAVGDRLGAAWSLNMLGDLAWCSGDHERAAALYSESLVLRQKLGDKRGIAACLCNLGRVALRNGDAAAATGLFRDSLGLFVQIGVPRGIAFCLEGIACLAEATAQPRQAALLLGAAESLLKEAGIREEATDRILRERTVAATKKSLSEPSFTATWVRGRAMRVHEATAYALALIDARLASDAKEQEIAGSDGQTARPSWLAPLR